MCDLLAKHGEEEESRKVKLPLTAMSALYETPVTALRVRMWPPSETAAVAE